MEWQGEFQEEQKKLDHEALQAAVGRAFHNLLYAAQKSGRKLILMFKDSLHLNYQAVE